jgi:hypothetical protein
MGRTYRARLNGGNCIGIALPVNVSASCAGRLAVRHLAAILDLTGIDPHPNLLPAKRATRLLAGTWRIREKERWLPSPLPVSTKWRDGWPLGRGCAQARGGEGQLQSENAPDLPLSRVQSKIPGMTTLTPQAFVDKWRYATLKERSAYQEHFIDLCRLCGQPTPAEADPTGENYAFEPKLKCTVSYRSA